MTAIQGPKGCVLLGATGGIGQQIARRLIARGTRVIGTYLSSEMIGHQLQKEGCQRLISLKANVTIRADLEAVLAAAIKELPELDLLVNAVGYNARLPISNMTYESWRLTLDVNLYGVMLAAQIFGSHMVERSGGAIVNIASVAGVRPLPRAHDYVAAKAAILGLTRSLALEFAPKVTVNAVAPGWINSGAHARTTETHSVELSRIPLQRFGTADDVVDAVMFLGAKRGYVTGQTLVVDGGYAL